MLLRKIVAQCRKCAPTPLYDIFWFLTIVDFSLIPLFIIFFYFSFLKFAMQSYSFFLNIENSFDSQSFT